MSDKEIMILIPAYNEEGNIGKILSEVKKYEGKYFEEILVVDDNSEDDTAEIAGKIGARVISHHENKGYGATQHTGHRYAVKEDFDYVLQLDADGQHPPRYIPIFMKKLEKSDYSFDLLIGSRWKNDSFKEYGVHRRFFIRLFTWLINSLTSSNFSDITCGYKLYSIDLLKDLSKMDDQNPAVGQMMEIGTEGYNVKEISIPVPKKKRVKSHLDSFSIFVYPLRVMKMIAVNMLSTKK